MRGRTLVLRRLRARWQARAREARVFSCARFRRRLGCVFGRDFVCDFVCDFVRRGGQNVHTRSPNAYIGDRHITARRNHRRHHRRDLDGAREQKGRGRSKAGRAPEQGTEQNPRGARSRAAPENHAQGTLYSSVSGRAWLRGRAKGAKPGRDLRSPKDQGKEGRICSARASSLPARWHAAPDHPNQTVDTPPTAPGGPPRPEGSPPSSHAPGTPPMLRPPSRALPDAPQTRLNAAQMRPPGPGTPKTGSRRGPDTLYTCRRYTQDMPQALARRTPDRLRTGPEPAPDAPHTRDSERLQTRPGCARTVQTPRSTHGSAWEGAYLRGFARGPGRRPFQTPRSAHGPASTCRCFSAFGRGGASAAGGLPKPCNSCWSGPEWHRRTSRILVAFVVFWPSGPPEHPQPPRILEAFADSGGSGFRAREGPFPDPRSIRRFSAPPPPEIAACPVDWGPPRSGLESPHPRN